MSTTKEVTKRSTKKVVKEEVVVEAPVVDTEHETDSEESEKKTRTRRVVNKESLIASIQELNAQLESELTKQKDASEKHVIGNRFIRRVHKALRLIETDSKKVLKMKTSNRKASATSGFMKPVMISEEMATFTGLDKTGSFPRPTITKFVCEYIKKNNLQNPKDKREFRVDTSLQKLLKYNPSNPPKDEQGQPIPMTYFRLQKYMQHHFKQNTPAVAVVAPVVEVVPTPVVAPVVVEKATAKKKASK